MNERIRELIEKATITEYGVDNGFDLVTFHKEKFAELIVRECIDVVGKNTASPNGVQALIKHFGVEV